MKSIAIVKTRSTPHGRDDTIEHISLSLSKAGILTQVHNLMQVAGLAYESMFTYDAEHYDDNGKRKTLQKRKEDGVYLIYEK